MNHVRRIVPALLVLVLLVPEAGACGRRHGRRGGGGGGGGGGCGDAGVSYQAAGGCGESYGSSYGYGYGGPVAGPVAGPGPGYSTNMAFTDTGAGVTGVASAPVATNFAIVGTARPSSYALVRTPQGDIWCPVLATAPAPGAAGQNLNTTVPAEDLRKPRTLPREQP